MKKFIIALGVVLAVSACGPKKTAAPVEDAQVDSVEVVAVDSTAVEAIAE